jgi:RNA polymerase sigma-70 factor (ECF subfamily)
MGGAIAATAIGQRLTMDAEGPSDEELLAEFLDGDGFAAEDAFRMLVGRHGPRVLRICRHILDREHDAEDAFQATFLALARDGGSIRDRCALAAWLHEVAYRTSLKTRARRSRRRTLERQVMEMTPPRDEPDRQHELASLDELRPVLHEEVVGLPDKYRIPVVLSYLEGKTNEEVAELLKWPVGTVKGRLSRGRALLRSRLMRRGVALSAATLLVALPRASAAVADVPAELLQATLRQAIGPRSLTPAADSLVSPGQPLPDIDGQASPPRPARWYPRSPRLAPLLSAALLLVAFTTAVLVAGFVSAAAYGGRFPDLRSAFSGLMPKWNAPAVPCHPESIR